MSSERSSSFMELTNMDNVKSFIGGVSGSAVSFLGLSLEDADHIVGIVCGVVGLIITIISTVILPLLRRIKKAKADGKITLDEVTDIIESTTEDMQSLKRHASEHLQVPHKEVNDDVKGSNDSPNIDNRTNK